MTFDFSLKEMQKEWHGTLKSYVIGFLVSFVLTTISFSLVITRLFSDQILIYTIMGLAIAQGITQLLFFLHVGQEGAKARWVWIALCFTVFILLIVLIGSLWIMHDLNDRMMPNMNHQHEARHFHD